MFAEMKTHVDESFHILSGTIFPVDITKNISDEYPPGLRKEL
jgi:hypothetical protein